MDALWGAVVTLFVLIVLVIVAAGRSDRTLRDDHDKLEADIVKLEILACGFEQFDDGSVRPQRTDQIRFDCITNAVP